MVKISRIIMEFAVGILVMFGLFSLVAVPEQPLFAGAVVVLLFGLAALIAVYGLNIGEIDRPLNVLVMGIVGALLALYALFLWASGFTMDVILAASLFVLLPAVILFRYNMGKRQKRMGVRG